MRLYTFTHFMLSTMAQGIQAGHAQMELFNKYTPVSTYYEKQHGMLYNWSRHHKTHVALNGGVSPDLDDLLIFLANTTNPYPYAAFREDESLGKLMTSIAMVLPEKIYETAALIRNREIVFRGNASFIQVDQDTERYSEVEKILSEFGTFTHFEVELMHRLNQCGLAR